MSTGDDVFEHSTMGPTEAMIDETAKVRVFKVCSACDEAGHCSYECSSHEGEKEMKS